MRGGVVVFLASFVMAVCATPPEPFRMALCCFNCRDGSPRLLPKLVIQQMLPFLAEHPHVSFEAFDIGTGSLDGVVSKYDALVVKNYSLVVFEPLPHDNSRRMMTMLTRLHDVHPHLLVITLHQGASGVNHHSSSWPPWLAEYGTRYDEVGYLSGYIAGTLSTTRRVALVCFSTLFWVSRAMASAFVVGLRDACSDCIADLQFESYNDIHAVMPNVYGKRGADVSVLASSPSTFDHIQRVLASGKHPQTFVHAVWDRRATMSSAMRQVSPYSVNTDRAVPFILQEIIRVALGAPFQSGTFFMDAASDVVGLAGCTDQLDTNTPPCNNTGVSREHHHAIHHRYRRLRKDRVATGVSLTSDATTSALVFPTLRAGQIRSLDDAAGDATTWRHPVPVALGDVKVVLYSAPFTEVWSYVYFAHAMTHMPTTALQEHLDCVRFAAAGFDTFTIFFGGRWGEKFRGQVTKVVHPCDGVPESCTVNPTVSLIGMHPVGGRDGACVARLGTTDVLFVHGGLEADGRVVDDAYAFNVTSGVWTLLPPAPHARHGHTCTGWSPPPSAFDSGETAERDCVIVAGGTQGDSMDAPPAPVGVFCMQSLRWEATTGAVPPPLSHPCVVPTDTRLYLFGGELPEGPSNNCTLWALTPGFVWVSHDTEAPEGLHLRLPQGPMRCVNIRLLDGAPYNQTRAGPFDPERTTSFHRIHVFPLHLKGGTYVASSRNMTLLTLPWLECWRPKGLHLSPDGLGCDKGTHHSASDDGAGAATTLIVGIGVPLILLIVIAVALAIGRVVIKERRLALATRFLPTGHSKLSVATVQLRFLRPAAANLSHGQLVNKLAGKLRQIATMYQVHEARRFGDTVTYTCHHPQRMMGMLMKQFEYVHYDFATHGCTLSAALHYGEVTVGTPAALDVPRCTFSGPTVKAVYGMLARCPHGVLVSTVDALCRVEPTVMKAHAHVGARVSVPSRGGCVLECSQLEPKYSREAREAAVELSQLSDTPRGMSVSRRADRIEPLQNEICLLFLKELFRSLRSNRQHAGDVILGYLSDRFAAPPPPPMYARRASIARMQRENTVSRAVLREMHEPIVAVRDANRAKVPESASFASHNPFDANARGSISSQGASPRAVKVSRSSFSAVLED